MAFLDDNKDQQNQTQGSQANGAGQGVPPPTQSVSAPGASDVGSGVSTAGVGAGGTGGWTNIQAYINANRDNNSGANALTNTVGKQFDQEQNDMQSSANTAKGNADKAVSDNQIGQDQASQMIDQYGLARNTGDNVMKKTVGDQFKGALNGAYGGPTDWSYGMSSPTQNYGNALGTEQGFQGMLGNLYNNAAGGQISSGQLALQNQLDVNNPLLNDARNNMSARYKALQDASTQTIGDTNQAIQNDVTRYGQNQADLKNYMTDAANNAKGTLDNYYNASSPAMIGPQINLSQLTNRFNSINDLLGTGGVYAPPPQQSRANPFLYHPSSDGSSDDGTIGPKGGGGASGAWHG